MGARNVRVSDQKLFETLKKTLLQSLKQVILTQEYIKSLDDEMLEPKFHGHPTREPPNFCGHCDKEVFGIFFIRASDPDGQGLIHCLNCAHRRSHSLKGFICLEEYKLKELSDVYDAFKIHQQQQTPTASPGINAELLAAMGQYQQYQKPIQQQQQQQLNQQTFGKMDMSWDWFCAINKLNGQ